MRTTIILLTMLTLAACGSEREAPVPTDETRAPEPEGASPGEETSPAPGSPDEAETAPPDAPEPPAPGPVARRPTLTAAQRTSLRDAIRAGRRAAAEDDFSEADARFTAALEIDPHSSRLRCEAGYVAFRAGELDRALRLIDQALAVMPASASSPPAVRRPRAMCLYNAGLVYEARGRANDARRVWASSVALRPNATVQSRLDALGEVEDEDTDVLELDPAATFATHRLRVRDAWCERPNAGFVRAQLESCDQIEVSHRAVEGTPAGLEAEIVELRLIVDGASEAAYLVLRSRGGVRAVLLADLYSPGVMGMGAVYELREVRYQDVMTGGTTEVVLEVFENANDENMGVCNRDGVSRRRLVVCTSDDGAPSCGALVLEDVSYFEQEECEDWDSGETIEARSEEEGYRAQLRLEGADVIVTALADSPEPPPADILGRHPVADVLGSLDSVGISAF